MSAIRVEGVGKSFGSAAPVLADFSLVVGGDERVTVVGPSGAGKTTLLRLIAGFERPDRGRIFIGDREVTSLPPEERDVAFVFQSHALYPHLTVAENLAFPLRLRKVEGREIARRVTGMATLLRIDHLEERRPGELSGGEAQRVALGRALIREPAALLMDEPLSSLPPDLRAELRREIVKLHGRRPCAMVYVTHDHEEALALGDRVAAVNGGKVQQVGRPQEIYERPTNRFVAGFIGKPQMNFIDLFTANGSRNLLPGVELPPLPCERAAAMGLRPEHMEICDEAGAWFKGRVSQVLFGGAHFDVVVEFSGGELVMRRFGGCDLKVGDLLALRAHLKYVHWFDVKGERLKESGE